MYLSTANTLNFATNSGSRMYIGSTGSVFMTSTLSLGNYLQLTSANTFIYGGTTVGSIQYGNSTSSTHLKTYGATHATLANVIQLTNNSVVSLTLSATGAATFTGALTGTTANFTGQLTLGSTITNGTYTYTLPSATGTLALTSALSGYLPLTGGTLTGSLTGTSATFSGTVSANAGNQVRFYRPDSSYPSASWFWQVNMDASNNLDFGVNAGAYKFRIESTGAATFNSTLTAGSQIISELSTANDIRLLINPTATAVKISATYNTTGSYQPLTFLTSDTERMRITSGGNVLIGSSTDAGYKLDVNGEIRTFGSGAGLTYADRSSGSYVFYATGGATYFYNGANIAQINMTTGIYTPLSNINKKKDFELSEIGLNAILGLKPTLYRMKSDESDNEKELGFIAQEVKEFIPQAYVESGEDEDKFIGLNYNAIVAALVKGMQEQQAQIEKLKLLIK